MNEIIDKYFKEERVRYFHPADLIADDHYVRYEFNGDRIILSIGCNEGEIPVFLCNTPERLEQVLKTILYQ